jgi:RHS repeat-associated protein
MTRQTPYRALHAAMMLILAAIGSVAFAAGDPPSTPPGPPLAPGNGRYIMVLRLPGQGPKAPKHMTVPDFAKLGGTLRSTADEQLVIDLPVGMANRLRDDDNVLYLQRVWMGEPLSSWDETHHTSTSGPRLKADWDATDLTWTTGVFQYDGAGNIKAMGANNKYTYDTAGRIIASVVNGTTETYGYDSFGNLNAKGLAGQVAVIPVDSSSNRLTGEEYDAAGNVTTQKHVGGHPIEYRYDALGMMTEASTAVGQNLRMIYTADDERIGVQISQSETRWKIRAIDGSQVLREYRDTSGWMAWDWASDYVYAEARLVGGEREEAEGGIRHFHLDHLGNVRLITSANHEPYARHDYYPFGIEQTLSTQEFKNFYYRRNEAMKFAGHERDFQGDTLLENTDYLDYMHARYYNPNLGRFLSVDPAMDLKKTLPIPQRWNRYSYTANNPVRYVDPDGKEAIPGELAAFDPSLGSRSLWGSFVKPALRIDSIQEAVSGWNSGSFGERVMIAGVVTIAALEIGSNFLTPEKAAVSRAGSVMLGHFPEYIEAGARAGARVFNVPARIWESMTPAAQWVANQKFLDRAIQRGASILLSTDPAKVRAGSALEREIEYMAGKGYKIVRDAASDLWRFEKVK